MSRLLLLVSLLVVAQAASRTQAVKSRLRSTDAVSRLSSSRNRKVATSSGHREVMTDEAATGGTCSSDQSVVGTCMQYWLCPTQQNYMTHTNLCPGGSNILCCLPDLDKIRAATHNGASAPTAAPATAAPAPATVAPVTAPNSQFPSQDGGPNDNEDSSDFDNDDDDSGTDNVPSGPYNGPGPYGPNGPGPYGPNGPGPYGPNGPNGQINGPYGAPLQSPCFGGDSSNPRMKLVQAAMALYSNRGSGRYDEDDQRWSGISGHICPPSSPSASDCSSSVTWIYWTVFGNGPDFVNGANWAAGNTNSLLTNGREVTMDQAQPGDVVFYGASHTSLSHSAIYVGNGKVVSHGRDPASFFGIGNYKMIRNYF